jgi:hypothetical protein
MKQPQCTCTHLITDINRLPAAVFPLAQQQPKRVEWSDVAPRLPRGLGNGVAGPLDEKLLRSRQRKRRVSPDHAGGGGGNTSLTEAAPWRRSSCAPSGSERRCKPSPESHCQMADRRWEARRCGQQEQAEDLPPQPAATSTRAGQGMHQQRMQARQRRRNSTTRTARQAGQSDRLDRGGNTKQGQHLGLKG